MTSSPMLIGKPIEVLIVYLFNR